MSDSPMARLSSIWKNKKALPVFVLLAVGLLLLVLSMQTGTEPTESRPSWDEAEYTRALEERTCRLLAAVSGAGEVQVMITMESFYQEHYAHDVIGKTARSEHSTETERQETLVLQSEKNGEKAPIVSSVSLPRVRGVSVVCTGGADPGVQMKILSLVQALFDISANRVSVTN